MSWVFWKSYESDDDDPGQKGGSPVDEQHALPVGVYWKPEGSDEAVGVDEANGLPVSIMQSAPTRLVRLGPTEIPGITAANAFDALDQFGTVLTFTDVPGAGTIHEINFHDLDDEGIDKQVWIFSAPPTLADSDAAFSIADEDNLKQIGVFIFSTWRDGINSQMGKTANTPCDYVMAGNKFYVAVQTAGVDNIAAGSMPQISMIIERKAAG